MIREVTSERNKVSFEFVVNVTVPLVIKATAYIEDNDELDSILEDGDLRILNIEKMESVNDSMRLSKHFKNNVKRDIANGQVEIDMNSINIIPKEKEELDLISTIRTFRS